VAITHIPAEIHEHYAAAVSGQTADIEHTNTVLAEIVCQGTYSIAATATRSPHSPDQPWPPAPSERAVTNPLHGNWICAVVGVAGVVRWEGCGGDAGDEQGGEQRREWDGRDQACAADHGCGDRFGGVLVVEGVGRAAVGCVENEQQRQ
jgi:hypothetical protein